MITSNWDFSHVEKNFAIYYRLCFGVVLCMRVSITGERKDAYGIGSKPLIWFGTESLVSEFLKK
jgi:hypothetical protein